MTEMNATIRANKALLRKQIQEKIAKLSTDDKQRQSDVIYRQLINSPTLKNSQRISVYLSTDNEISTDSLVKKFFELNKQVFVPRYKGDVMQMVKLDSVHDWDTLPMTKWHIKQPSVKDQREDAMETGGLDLVIAPGVAFTKDGWRMGHGKGYYDSYFTKLFALHPNNRPTTIGICFKEQLVEDLPRHEHDIRLDQIMYTTDN